MNHKERVSEIASLMEEFRLSEARLEEDGFTIAFKRNRKTGVPVVVAEESDIAESYEVSAPPAVPAAPVGVPVMSPMNGIFYASPNPSSPPFVKEGDVITAGQIIGLVEAMKLFNEIPSTASGTVKKILVESGQVVNPGDPILLVG